MHLRSQNPFEGVLREAPHRELAARQVEQGHVLWPETVAWLLTGQRGRPATPPHEAMLHLSAAVKAGDLGFVAKVLQDLKLPFLATFNFVTPL